jgi:hypothetical protein
MRTLLALGLLAMGLPLLGQKSGADSGVDSLLDVKRIYVSPLTGGAQAEALRELIIAGLDSTKLFILTDNIDRADAVLKGAADDKSFTDTFDTYEDASVHENVTKVNSGSTSSSIYSKAGGLAANVGGAENDSHHIRERKHEAFAAVRLCNKDGDVLWSTTQESLGAKFRGSGADVAAKIAKQIAADYDKEKRLAQRPAVATPAVNK